MLDGADLAVFVAIAEERSFSRAAEKLGIAQSVVSKRLRRLEDQLETRLVDRSVRTAVRLTRVGSIFLPEAISTLAQLQKAERSAVNLGRGNTGPLRIGFVFSGAMNGTLPAILSALRTALPNLRFEPQLMETPEQLAALEAGKLDIGLMRPRPSYPAVCRDWTIHSEGLVVCLSSLHPLADQERLTPCQLAGESFIVPQFHEQVGLVDNIRMLAKAGRFVMPRIIRTGDFVTAACLAAAGGGVVLAPASLANLSLDGVRFRDVSNYGESIETVLVHHEQAPREAVRIALNVFK